MNIRTIAAIAAASCIVLAGCSSTTSASSVKPLCPSDVSTSNGLVDAFSDGFEKGLTDCREPNVSEQIALDQDRLEAQLDTAWTSLRPSTRDDFCTGWVVADEDTRYGLMMGLGDKVGAEPFDVVRVFEPYLDQACS